MAKVRKANVLLTVNEDEVSKYLCKGFDLVGDDGKILKESTPVDLGQYQRAYSEQKTLLEEKDKEIAKLKAEIQKLKKAGEKKSPAEVEEDEGWDDYEEEIEEVVEEKPKKKRKTRV